MFILILNINWFWLLAGRTGNIRSWNWWNKRITFLPLLHFCLTGKRPEMLVIRVWWHCSQRLYLPTRHSYIQPLHTKAIVNAWMCLRHLTDRERGGPVWCSVSMGYSLTGILMQEDEPSLYRFFWLTNTSHKKAGHHRWCYKGVIGFR